MIKAMEKNQCERKNRGRSVAMLNRGKEGVTKKVTFKQRPEGGEGISLAGRACQEKGAARVKTRGIQGTASQPVGLEKC